MKVRVDKRKVHELEVDGVSQFCWPGLRCQKKNRWEVCVIDSDDECCLSVSLSVCSAVLCDFSLSGCVKPSVRVRST